MDSHLLKTKSIEQLVSDVEHGGKALRRSLTAWDLTLLGIGAIIGTGIFVLTGTAAAKFAGPAIMLSFVLGGVACAFVGLCYSELAAMIPVAGSTYSYTYATLGEIFAWIIGWDLILEYLAAASAVSVGWAGYFKGLMANMGVIIPDRLATSPVTWDAASGSMHLEGHAADLRTTRGQVDVPHLHRVVMTAWEEKRLPLLGGTAPYPVSGWVHVDTFKATDGHLRQWLGR